MLDPISRVPSTEAEAQQAEIDRLETFVTRFGAKASKVGNSGSRRHSIWERKGFHLADWGWEMKAPKVTQEPRLKEGPAAATAAKEIEVWRCCKWGGDGDVGFGAGCWWL